MISMPSARYSYFTPPKYAIKSCAKVPFIKIIDATINLGRKSSFYTLWLLEVCFIEGLYIYYMKSGQLFTTSYGPDLGIEFYIIRIFRSVIQL